MKKIYNTFGIYGIRNNLTNTVYIGKTSVSFGDRWDCHRAQLNGGYHDNNKLQSDWNKYGEDAFTFYIIEECSNESVLNDLECKYIESQKELGEIYNLGEGGNTPMLGKHLSEETKRKIGEKNRVNMTGRKASPSTCAKKRESMKKYWDNVSDEQRLTWGEKISEATTGHKWTEESRAAFANLQRTRPNSAKYSIEQVHEIRRLREEEQKTYREIENLTNIPYRTIYQIATYRRWKYV